MKRAAKKSARVKQRKSVYKVAEAARLLGVNPKHVSDLIEEGSLEALDIGRRSRHFWRIPIEAIDRFKARRSNLKGGRP